MRLAYFVDEYPPFFRGGLGTYAMEITRRFAAEGHAVTVFTRNRGDDPTRECREGIEVHRPRLMDFARVLSVLVPDEVNRWDPGGRRFFQETLHYNVMAASKLVNRLMKSEGRRPEIVVAHDWLAAIGGVLAARNLDLPFVFHFHSTEHGRTGNGSPTVVEIERIAAGEADLIVTVSDAMRDELVRLGVPERKIRVVHNGVDTSKYRPDAVPEKEVRAFRDAIGVGDAPVVFFIGRLTRVKGIDSLIRAMPLIRAGVPDARLVILGSGEEEGLIDRLIRELDLEPAVVRTLSIVDEETRIRYYAACDVAVFPSKYEPFGIVCTEAMAMGRPVVVGARGTSGMREQVIPAGAGRCGFHINPYDPADIARYTVALLRDPELRDEMGRNGRRRAEECFTWERIARRTLDVYREAIESAAGHRGAGGG